jgi:hypothetical protein
MKEGLDVLGLRKTLGGLALSSRLLSDDVVPIEVAIIDIAEASDELYGQIIPKIVGGPSTTNPDAVLEGIVDLWGVFRHMQWHIEQALPVLNRLMELPGRSDPQGSNDLLPEN